MPNTDNEPCEDKVVRLRVKLIREKNNVITLTNEITILNHKINKMRQTIADKDDLINRFRLELRKVEDVIF